MSTKPAISTLFRAKNAIACSAMTIAAFLAFTLTAMPAYAQGAAVCVSCTGPDLNYRCKVVREDGTPLKSGVQYLCISKIAREMGHQRCAVGSQTSGVCQGIEKTIIYRGNAPVNPFPRAADGATTNTTEPVTVPGTHSADDHKGEPKTLLELTDQTVKKTQDQLKKTGQTISDAAKATGEGITDAAKKTGDTVGTAVKKTGETVVGAVKKSGEVMGDAAKSTFHCITSFFTDCF